MEEESEEMTAQEEINDNEELVEVEGLKLKKYQMKTLELMSQMSQFRHKGNVNEFLTEIIITGLLQRMKGLNLGDKINELTKDGNYEYRTEKVITITGAPAEVLLNDLEEHQPYEISDNTSSDNLPVVGIYKRVIGKVKKE